MSDALLLADVDDTVPADAKAEYLLRVQYHNGDVFVYDFERCECEENFSHGECGCLAAVMLALESAACVGTVDRVSDDDLRNYVTQVHHPDDLHDHLAYYGETCLAEWFPEEESVAGIIGASSNGIVGATSNGIFGASCGGIVGATYGGIIGASSGIDSDSMIFHLEKVC